MYISKYLTENNKNYDKRMAVGENILYMAINYN